MLLGLHDYDSESKSLVEDSECEVTSRIIVLVRQLEDVFGETVCESISGGAMFFCMCVGVDFRPVCLGSHVSKCLYPANQRVLPYDPFLQSSCPPELGCSSQATDMASRILETTRNSFLLGISEKPFLSPE